MEILVTRHGQTDWNVLGKIQGQTDIELNEIGKKQAEEAKELIKKEEIDLIIVSPLKRAKQTAEIINQDCNVLILEDDRLMERNFGNCEGLTKSEIRELKEVDSAINDMWNYNKNINFNHMETMHDFWKSISFFR